MQTTKSILCILIICAIFLYPKQAASQIQLGGMIDAVFVFDEMKVFKTADNYNNNKFVISDALGKNYFMKDKKKILEVKDCWGYTVDYNSTTYLFRVYEKAVHYSVFMTIQGSICLYIDGAPYYHPKKKQLLLYMYNRSAPVYFSVGLDGPIQVFKKENMKDAVTDDKEFSEQVDALSLQDFILSRVHVVQFYNKRHPTGKDESDLFASADQHKKK